MAQLYPANFEPLPPNGGIPHMRPRPGRRRLCIIGSPVSTLISVLLLLCLCAPTLADRRSRFEARENDILYDSRQPPLERRHFNLESSSTTHKASMTASKSASSSTTEAEVTETAQSTSNGIVSAAMPSGFNLPKAFDGGLGTNFTRPSCPTFLKDMVKNETFVSCLPFSVLLQNSMSFFNAARNVTTLDPVLSASCNIVTSACSALMASYASQLQASSACYQDYDRENPTVRQAYNGLVSYDILYRASCQRTTPSAANNQSTDYCFSDAITNISSPSDSYIYYLPLGVPLPATSTPTCSQCLKDTIAIFAASAGNRSQPLRLTYGSASTLINQQCGPNFVDQNVSGAIDSGTAMAFAPRLGGVSIALVLAIEIANMAGLV